ncbi:hypothetical protein G0R13_004395 [Salmonella enterica]|nr:hypothetical protein [Salmonella enterica]ELZ0009418.1 hypothetical protein [Salmonella enterica]
MLGVLTHSQRRLKTPQFCSIFFDLSKSHQSLASTGFNHYSPSASYPLSINTRIARVACSKNKHPKAATEQRRRQQFTPAFSTAPVTENVGKTAYQVDGLTA